MLFQQVFLGYQFYQFHINGFFFFFFLYWDYFQVQFLFLIELMLLIIYQYMQVQCPILVVSVRDTSLVSPLPRKG